MIIQPAHDLIQKHECQNNIVLRPCYFLDSAQKLDAVANTDFKMCILQISIVVLCPHAEIPH